MLRVFTQFDALFLLMRSIRASMSVLFWSFLVLAFFQMCFGMFLLQLAQGFTGDPDADESSRDKVFKYFGTFTMAQVTMFEITFANWGPPCRVLMENIHESLAMAVVVYRCLWCFAVVKVIAAVFITETTRIVSNDTEVAIMRKNRAAQGSKKHMKELFYEMDPDHDGFLTIAEIEAAYSDPHFSSWAGTLELALEDLENIFRIIDTGSGRVRVDELLDGAMHMKGAARESVLMTVLKYCKRFDERFDTVLAQKPSRSF